MRTNWIARLALLGLVAMLAGCGYNSMQRQDEGVKAAWSEVLNQYQRRADLIPNLVATVKGYAQQEQDVLVKVTEARAKVGQIQVNAEDAASLAQFQQTQGELSSALSRLDGDHRELPEPQVRPGLPRPAGAARRHREPHHRRTQSLHRERGGLQHLIRSFPNNLTAMMFGYETKPNFSVQNEAQISTAPKVEFATPPPVAPTN
jgi:LemA protein